MSPCEQLLLGLRHKSKIEERHLDSWPPSWLFPMPSTNRASPMVASGGKISRGEVDDTFSID